MPRLSNGRDRDWPRSRQEVGGKMGNNISVAEALTQAEKYFNDGYN